MGSQFYWLGKSNGSRVYNMLNIAFAGLVFLILLYSLAFSGTSHPIPALLTDKTGIVPPSKGLSQAFSLIVRGDISSALAANEHSIRIFTFFVSQLVLRIALMLTIGFGLIRSSYKLSVLGITDIVISALLFGICFYPLIAYTINMLVV